MPIQDSPYTEPDTILALYSQPDDEVLLAEIALLTGAAQRDAINQALASTSTTATGTGFSAAENANPVRPRFKVSPDINDEL